MIEELILGILIATVRLCIPILVAALGETFAQRSGVLNLGLDGTMLAGAFGGFVAAYVTGNLWLGVLVGLFIGALVGLLMAFLSVTLQTSQVVNGLMIGILCYGLVTYLVRTVMGSSYILSPYVFDGIHIPWLSDLPYLGPLLFSWPALVYIALALVPLSFFILFRTTMGMKIRAVGENPAAADAAGIDVTRVRYICVVVGGMMAGFAGAYFNLAYVPVFIEQGLAGRGWIALALVIFGSWNPIWIFAASIFFSFVDALQIRLQYSLGYAIPFQFLAMLPYILTIVALIIKSKKGSTPAALTVPYTRE